MRKLTCHCEQVFNVDLPEIVNLDEHPETINDIANGSFLTCVCPTCNSELHTDLKTRLEWPSKKTNIVLIPEIDRFAYISGTLPPEENAEVVIGYAELADRVAVRAANLDPLAIETIKYHLATKAGETNPDAHVTILFDKKKDDGSLEFHLHGLRANEVAVSVIPLSLYAAILDDSRKNADNDPYAALKNGAYLSVKNILIEDTTNE
jgi:hypothetical protein